MQIRRAYLAADIHHLMKTDEVYKEFGIQKIESWSPPATSEHLWIVAQSPDGDVGFMYIRKTSEVLGEVHIAVYPKYHHTPASRQLGEEILNWLKTKTKLETLVGFIPEPKQNVVEFAKKFNFKVIGILNKSLQYKGDLINQVITQYQFER